MHRYFLTAVIGTSLFGLPMFVGCDDKAKVEKKEETKDANGNITKDEYKAKTDSSGNTKETSKTEVKTPEGKSVDKSTSTTDANGNVTKSKTEHETK